MTGLRLNTRTNTKECYTVHLSSPAISYGLTYLSLLMGIYTLACRIHRIHHLMTYVRVRRQICMTEAKLRRPRQVRTTRKSRRITNTLISMAWVGVIENN